MPPPLSPPVGATALPILRIRLPISFRSAIALVFLKHSSRRGRFGLPGSSSLSLWNGVLGLSKISLYLEYAGAAVLYGLPGTGRDAERLLVAPGPSVPVPRPQRGMPLEYPPEAGGAYAQKGFPHTGVKWPVQGLPVRQDLRKHLLEVWRARPSGCPPELNGCPLDLQAICGGTSARRLVAADAVQQLEQILALEPERLAKTSCKPPFRRLGFQAGVLIAVVGQPLLECAR